MNNSCRYDITYYLERDEYSCDPESLNEGEDGSFKGGSGLEDGPSSDD